MPLGETGYTTRGVKIERFVFEPVPTNDYQCRLITEHCEIAKSQNVGSVPYVNGLRLELLDTADQSREGSKNKLVFPKLFTSVTVGRKAKKASFEMPAGPAALARALGQELDVPGTAIKTVPEYDKQGQPTGEAIQYVDPKFLISWLKANDGMVISAHVRKVKKADQDPFNEVAYFIPSENLTGSDTATWGETSTSTNGVSTKA